MDPDQLFAQNDQKYGLPAGYTKRVYQIESGGGKNLYNPKSGAAGGFQFIPSTARAMGLSDPYDLAASADATGRLAVMNRGILQKNGIDDPNGAQLYLAHQQGGGGAVKLLNSNAPAGGVVGQNAVAWNGGDPNATGQQFANNVMGKFDGSWKPGQPVGQGVQSPTQGLSQSGMQQTAAADPSSAAPAPVQGLLGNVDPAKQGMAIFQALEKQRMAQAAQAAQVSPLAARRPQFTGFTDGGLLG